MTIKDFRELDVYRTAFAAAMEIFEFTKAWPADERFSLTSQIRRSSRSVCMNIAEAWRKRRYPAAFCSKLSDSDAEAGETLVSLDFALQCGYMSSDTYRRLSTFYNRICSQIVTMINQHEKWCK